MRLFLTVFSVIMFWIVLASCSEPNANSGRTQEPLSELTTSKGKVNIPGDAFIDGRDMEADPRSTLMDIHIWNKVPRTRPVCKMGHGDKVSVMAAKYSDQDAKYYLKVKNASCKGWIAAIYISPEKQPPIGDLK